MSQVSEQKNSNSGDTKTEKMSAVSGEAPAVSSKAVSSETVGSEAGAEEGDLGKEDPQPLGDETKSNQRLSPETLFAFALPEAVQKKLKDEAIAQIQSKNDKDSEPTATEDKPSEAPKSAAVRATPPEQKVASIASSKQSSSELGQSSSKAGYYVVAGMLFASVIYASFYLLDRSEFIPTNTEADLSTGPTAAESISGGDISAETKLAGGAESKESSSSVSSAAELVNASTSSVPEVSVPAGALDLRTISELSDSELVYALGGMERPVETLVALSKEASARNKPSTTSALVKLNSHPSYFVRVSVMRALANPSLDTSLYEDFISAVLAERLEDEDELVRGFTAKAYVVRGGGSASDILKKRLENEESPIVARILKGSIDKLSKSP
jgi:hypothetical protein